MAESKLPPNIPINTFGRGLGFDLVKGEFFMVKTRNVSFNQNVVKKGTKIAFLPYFMNFIQFPDAMKEEIQERLSRILLKYISKGIVDKRDTLITEIKKTPRGFIYNIESGNEREQIKQS